MSPFMNSFYQIADNLGFEAIVFHPIFRGQLEQATGDSK
jgi:hypothetical protein